MDIDLELVVRTMNCPRCDSQNIRPIGRLSGQANRWCNDCGFDPFWTVEDVKRMCAAGFKPPKGYDVDGKIIVSDHSPRPTIDEALETIETHLRTTEEKEALDLTAKALPCGHPWFCLLLLRRYQLNEGWDTKPYLCSVCKDTGKPYANWTAQDVSAQLARFGPLGAEAPRLLESQSAATKGTPLLDQLENELASLKKILEDMCSEEKKSLLAEQLIAKMEALHLTSTSLLVIRIQEGDFMAVVEAVENLKPFLASIQGQCVVLDKGLKLEQVSAAEMNAAGWYRKNETHAGQRKIIQCTMSMTERLSWALSSVLSNNPGETPIYAHLSWAETELICETIQDIMRRMGEFGWISLDDAWYERFRNTVALVATEI